METTNSRKPTLQKIPVYEVRLVQSRRPLRLAERIVSNEERAAHTLHAMLGLTDREHFAALFLSGLHQVTGAHDRGDRRAARHRHRRAWLQGGKGMKASAGTWEKAPRLAVEAAREVHPLVVQELHRAGGRRGGGREQCRRQKTYERASRFQMPAPNV